MISIIVIHNFSIKSSRLLKIIIWLRVLVSTGLTLNLKWFLCLGWIFHRPIKGIRLVIWSASLIACHICWPISLIVWNPCSIRAINWNVIEVSTKSMPVSIWIWEQSSLKHLIIGRLYSWHKVTWWKSNLFHFSEKVFRIPIKDHFSDWY